MMQLQRLDLLGNVAFLGAFEWVFLVAASTILQRQTPKARNCAVDPALGQRDRRSMTLCRLVTRLPELPVEEAVIRDFAIKLCDF